MAALKKILGFRIKLPLYNSILVIKKECWIFSKILIIFTQNTCRPYFILKKPENNSLKTKVLTDISEEVCLKNHTYWKAELSNMKIDSQELEEVQKCIDAILPAHTFPYKKEGNMIIKTIFGYDEKTNTFDLNSEGILAKRFRSVSAPNYGHMVTSDKLGHDQFIFAYLGVHNPYHRGNDDFPIRPFGVFIKKDVEGFAYCHGALADVAEENELIDRSKLDKYYLLPENLRELKAMEIISDSDCKKRA